MAGLGRADRAQVQAATNDNHEDKTRTDRAQVPLIFEESVPGRRGADLPPRAFPSRDAGGRSDWRRSLPRRPGRLARSQRAAGDAPFPASVATQFRAGPAVLSAGLLHHEVQSSDQRRKRRITRFRRAPSADSRAPGAGRVGVDGPAGGGAGRNQRDGRHLAASRGRGARRVGRTADHPRLSSESAAGPATKSSFPTPRTAPIPRVRRWPASR